MEAAFVGAVVQPILAMLSSFIEEIGLASSVKQDLDNLKINVKLISAYLRDAEKRPVSKRESIKDWIEIMTSAIYDADDLLEEFNYEILSQQRKPENFFKKTIKDIISRKAHKIQAINKKLEFVVKLGADLRLTQVALLHRDVGDEASHQQDYGQYGDGSKILGRDGDKSKVIHMLLQSSGDLSVVAIIGLGGLGKTSLAKLIFDDVDSIQFDARIWVCVSTDFNVTTILKQMHGDEMLNTEALIKSLKKKLDKKKYLLVLDNVWNISSGKWDALTNCLFAIGADKESKILVTTRSNEVALCMHCHSRFQLKGLSGVDSWSLFGKKAFWNKGTEEIARVTTIGERMVERCKGVPLAILTLGGLLSKKDENEWSSIEISDLWNSTSNESDHIMLALRLSYDHFLPHLKPCFAYCSIYPKDYIFEKDNLIQLWIAHGFIESTPGSKVMLEDTGNEYFKILEWNSFFQDVQIDNHGNIRFCKMHDLVHDLAQSISKSECLVVDTTNINDSLTVRHLHLLDKKGTMPTIQNDHKLRTLFLACKMQENVSLKFKCLRVMNFENSSFIKELPKSIGKLRSLRYLNISRTNIRELPTSILKLYSLQTIRFMGCEYFGDLPKQLGSMISLTHLCFDDYCIRDWKQMPFEFGRLTNLQTLPVFIVGHDKGHTIEELGSLTRLRGELCVKYLEWVKGKNDAESANLAMKTNLSKLILEWSRERSSGENTDEDVLEALQPPPNLRSLTIEGFNGINFPTWMLTTSASNYILPDSLVEIKLSNCKKCQRIPTLGELPSLKFLEIRGMDNLKTIGREFYGNNNNKCVGGSSSSCIKLFPSLMTLKFEEVNDLVEWNEASTSATLAIEGGTVEVFPCLTDLKIVSCSQLKTAPTHFPFLKTLVYKGVRSGDALSNICSQVTTLAYLEIKSVSELTHLSEGLLQNNKNLTEVHIGDCDMLKSITREDECIGLENLSSLQHLSIESCSKLSHVGSMRGLTSLTQLSLRDCGEIRNLPMGLGSCTSLEKVEVSSCKNLGGEEGLMELKHVNSLKDLSLWGCNSELESFPFNTSVLKRLDLRGWKCVPQQIQHLPSALETLRIDECPELEGLPDWLGNLSSLQSLTISSCPKLSHLSSLQSLTSLVQLTIVGLDEITSVPIGGLGSCTSLETLHVINCRNLTSFVAQEEDLGELKSLSYLKIYNCGKLKGDFELQGSSNRFKGLEIGGFNDEVESFPMNYNMSVLKSSLTSLWLYGWPKLKSLLPQQIQQLAALEELFISGFSGLKELPDWLEKLSSLRRLYIEDCENLKYLPKSMQRLTNLQTLWIERCPILSEKCKEKSGRPEWSKISHIPFMKSGPEWSKISHIPFIIIDGNVVQDLP